jgi:hypothetical protein
MDTLPPFALRLTEVFDVEDAQDRLDTLSDGAYYWVCNNRYQFPQDVRDALPVEKLNLSLKVVEMDDDTFYEHIDEEDEKLTRVLTKKWNQYRKANPVPPRPLGEVDKKTTELRAKIAELKKPQKGTYIAPSMRKAIDESLQKEIAKAEANLREHIEVTLAAADDMWVEKHKNDFMMKTKVYS